MVAGDLAGKGDPKLSPKSRELQEEELRGSPSLRSLAAITSGNHKSNSLIRSLLGKKGSIPSLLFASRGPPGIAV